MKGVAARYPRWDAGIGRVVSLAERINACVVGQQGAPRLAAESDELLALEAYVARQSRGLPLEVSIDGPARATWEAGHALYVTRIGQWNLVLDAIPNQRSLGCVGERVRMAPAAVRALRLHVDESPSRLERFDERAPPEPEAEQRKLVVDGRPGSHRDRLRAADLEVQRIGRDALEIGGVGEECENLRAAPSDELLLFEVVPHPRGTCDRSERLPGRAGEESTFALSVAVTFSGARAYGRGHGGRPGVG